LALRKAWQDPVTKDRYFTTPLCLKRARTPSEYDEPAKWAKKEGEKGEKGKGKGKYKKKGKGNGGAKGRGGGPIDCKSKTPDGKLICYKFNNESEECRRVKCQYLHVCGKCYKDHPVFRCPNLS